MKNIERQIRPGRKSRRREREADTVHAREEGMSTAHCLLADLSEECRISGQMENSCVCDQLLLPHCILMKIYQSPACLIYESLLMIGQALHLFNRNG